MTKRRKPAPFRPPGRRAGWRYGRLGFVLAGLTAAVTAGVQVSGKVKDPPLWLFVSLYALAAVLALVTALVKLRSTEAAEDRKWVEQVQQLLAVPPAEDGQLPRLSTLSSYRLGVSPSRYGSEDQRGTDPTCAETLMTSWITRCGTSHSYWWWGDSKAGKSRTAAEAARRLTLKGICPGCGLALPTGRGAGVQCNQCW